MGSWQVTPVTEAASPLGRFSTISKVPEIGLNFSTELNWSNSAVAPPATKSDFPS